jgi:hypothetical protein
MSFFVTKCEGCGQPWAELATDMMVRYRFRRVEAGKAGPSPECMLFIEEHLHECPPHAPLMTKKKAAAPVKEAQKKAQHSRLDQKETKKPAPTIPAKKSRDAIEKPHRSKKNIDAAALLKAAIQHPDSSTEMATTQPGQQDRISVTTNVGDGIMADAPSCPQPVDSMENRTDGHTKEIEQAEASPGQQLESGNALPPSIEDFSDLPVEMASPTLSKDETQEAGPAGGPPQRTTERATTNGNSSGGDEDEEMEDEHSDPASESAIAPAPPAQTQALAVTPAPSATAVSNGSSGAWALQKKCLFM